MENTNRTIELLETIVEIQLESQDRERKLFRLYSITAVVIWTVFFLFVLLVLQAYVF